MTESFHRRNLPHLHYEDGIYFVTYRLADAPPLKTIVTSFNRKRLDSFTLFKDDFLRNDKILDTERQSATLLTTHDLAQVSKNAITALDKQQ